MDHVTLSAGDGLVSDGTGKTGSSAPSAEGGLSLPAVLPDELKPLQRTTLAGLPVVPMRNGAMPVAALIDLYMAHYAGRDSTRGQRLSW